MAKLRKTTQLWVLVVVVLLDLLAVSLVVPLLPARYRELGVGAKALGFASSAYSLAQIVGVLALGALSDRSLGHRGPLRVRAARGLRARGLASERAPRLPREFSLWLAREVREAPEVGTAVRGRAGRGRVPRPGGGDL